MMNMQEKMDLEKMVDKHGIGNVINELSVIAKIKAQHIETNWQDETLSKAWKQVANKLDDTMFNTAANEL